MGMIDYRVTIDLRGFKRFQRILKSNRGEVTEAYNDWAKYYAEFTRKRFNRMSRGGGSWRRLKPATIRAKRREGWPWPKRILIRSKKMRDSLRPRFIRRTSTVKKRGIGMEISYGTKLKYRGGPRVSQVMKYHQMGGGNLPRRKIFINPDAETQKKMAKRMERAMKKIAKNI